MIDKEWHKLMEDARDMGMKVEQVKNYLDKEDTLLKVLKVNDAMVYRDVLWVRKVSKLSELASTENYYGSKDDYRINEVVILSEEDFWEFVNNFLSDYSFLEGKGGTNSTTANEVHEKSWTEWTDKEHNDWLRGSYRVSLVVMNEEFVYSIVVDPQGYNYGRYVGLLAMKKFKVFYKLKDKVESIEISAPKDSVACAIAQDKFPDSEILYGTEIKEEIAQ